MTLSQNCTFLVDKISKGCSMLFLNIATKNFLFWNFNQNSCSYPLKFLLKQCWLWLDQYFWHSFSYWSLSFLQLLILGSEDGCVDQFGSKNFVLIKSNSNPTPIATLSFHAFLLSVTAISCFVFCYKDSGDLKNVAYFVLLWWIPWW